VRNPGRNRDEWQGPFHRGQACPYDSRWSYRAECSGGNNVYYYISTDRQFERPGLDIAFAMNSVKKPLASDTIDERLAWLFQQQSGEYALIPKYQNRFSGYSLLGYDIDDAEGAIYPSSGMVSRGSFYRFAPI
jgi:hypothetical protein